jgi:hypothetical protein
LTQTLSKTTSNKEPEGVTNKNKRRDRQPEGGEVLVVIEKARAKQELDAT